MTTEMRYTLHEEVVFNDGFASELRGLWRIEGDYMGGPFYSLTAYDERRRIATVEGYAYAFFDKREYMREVEPSCAPSFGMKPQTPQRHEECRVVVGGVGVVGSVAHRKPRLRNGSLIPVFAP